MIQNDKGNSTNFMFSEKTFCILNAIISLLLYFFFSLIQVKWRIPLFVVKVVELILTTWFSVTLLSLLLELNTLKKLFISIMEKSYYKVISMGANRDFSDYNMDALNSIEKEIIKTYFINTESELIKEKQVSCLYYSFDRILNLLNIKSVLINVSHDIIIYSFNDVFYDYTVCMTWTVISKKGKQLFTQELWFVDEESRDNFQVDLFIIDGELKQVQLEKLYNRNRTSDPFGLMIKCDFHIKNDSYSVKYQYSRKKAEILGPGGFMFSDFAYGVNVTLSLHTNSNKYVPYLYTLVPLDIRGSKKGKEEISNEMMPGNLVKFCIAEWCLPGAGYYFGIKKNILGNIDEQ